MIEWSTEILKSSGHSLAMLPAAFSLGLIGSMTSCCNLPVLGAIAGYSGTLGHTNDRRSLLIAALFFMIGTVAAFAAIGAVSGFVGQVAASSLGLYWKLFAGFITVLIGLNSLNLLPLNLTGLGFRENSWKIESTGATIYGLAVGGGAATCSVLCNPILLMAVAVTTLQGHTLWGAAILTVFSIGYGLPMAGVLLGLGLGFRRLTSVVQKSSTVIKNTAGILLIALGFYLLATP